MPRPAGNIILDMVKRLCKLCPMTLSCDELAKDIYIDINMLRKCFNPNPITVDWQQLDTAHKQKFGENVPGVYYDGKYWVPTKDSLMNWIKADWTNYETYVLDRFDCIAPDTPIIIMRPNDMPDIVTPEDLMPSSPELEKPYHLTDVAILSHYEDGLVWSKLNWVMAKKTDKKQYNVVGIVPIKITEDHRVLGRWGKVVEYTTNDEVKKEIRIDPDSRSEFVYVSNIVERGGVGKMNVYPFWFKVIPIEEAFYSSVHVDPDLAWAWGYFVADGAVLHRRGSPCEVCFYTTEQRIVDKLVNILSEHYKGFEWVVSEARRAGARTNLGVANKPLLRIRARTKTYGRTLRALAKEFDSKFYTRGGLKKVPKEVLNADEETAKAFLYGYIAGDGMFNESKNAYQIDTNSKPLALGVYVLARKLGIYPRIEYVHNSNREYTHIVIPNNYSKPRQFDMLHMFKRAIIHESINHEPIVYDLNTDTHTFVAGGQVVHNCDDFARVFKAHTLEIFGVNAVGYAVGEIRDQNNNLIGYHAWNILVYYENGNIKLVYYEPQDDSVSENGEFVVSGEKWRYIPYWVEY